MKKTNLLVLIAFFVSTESSAEQQMLDRVAIIVGDGVVLESQVNSLMNTFKKRAAEVNTPIPPDDLLLEQIRERLIVEELQLQTGRRAGVRISDSELNEYVANIANQNNLSVDGFIDNLASQGESYSDFREQLRKELIIQRVQRGKVGGQIVITEQELAAFIDTEEAKIQLLPEFELHQILVRTLNEAEDIREKLLNAESFEDLAKSFSIAGNASNGGSLGWRKAGDLPDLFFNAINSQPINFISEPLKSGAGYHVLRLTDKRGINVEFQDQWKVRHILMSPTALRDNDFTREELENVRARLMDGEDFSLLAKEFSEDPGSANNGGEIDWQPLGATAPAFEAMMLKTPIGTVSEVFESQFGFHFLEVLDKRNYDKTQENIEDRAYGALFSRKFDEELENSIRTMRAEAFVEIKDLD